MDKIGKGEIIVILEKLFPISMNIRSNDFTYQSFFSDEKDQSPQLSHSSLISLAPPPLGLQSVKLQPSCAEQEVPEESHDSDDNAFEYLEGRSLASQVKVLKTHVIEAQTE